MKKMCSACKEEHDIEDFSVNRGKKSGRQSACKMSRRKYDRSDWKRTAKRLDRYEARDGDRKQAKNRVRTLVRCGIIPAAASLPCVDCGGMEVDGEAETLHEYDHWKGYSPEHHEDVQVRCVKCHRKVEAVRVKARRIEVEAEMEQAF